MTRHRFSVHTQKSRKLKRYPRTDYNYREVTHAGPSNDERYGKHGEITRTTWAHDGSLAGLDVIMSMPWPSIYDEKIMRAMAKAAQEAAR